jgi:hypothetical protein
MEQRFTTYSQYAISTSVNGIEDMEAETVNRTRALRVRRDDRFHAYRFDAQNHMM